MYSQRSFRKRFLLVIPVLGLIAFVCLEIFRVGPPPFIRIEPASGIIGRRTTVKIEAAEKVRGLSLVRVELEQSGRTEILAERAGTARPPWRYWGPATERIELTVGIGRDNLNGLKEGKAVIRVRADRAGTWLRHPGPAVQQLELPVRLTPPTLEVISTQTYVAQGGCEVVVYRVGSTSVRDGVLAGNWWFPGYPLPGGGKQDRFAVFAAPHDMTEPVIRLRADDGAGNQAERPFIDDFFPKSFRKDSIQLTDTFMGKVVPEILAQIPEFKERGEILETYLAINRELRETNARQLQDLGQKSEPAFLWGRPFLLMPNSKVMAAFADNRTYFCGTRLADRQDHLGLDLASTRHAAVPAANGGIIVLARYFGIYGNAVVVDHGYGLMTLYGHLSSISVAVDQKVARGDILGATGETGLAGGDHLHFAVLLQGLPVNPLEWCDPHWIRDRIAAKLGPAFRFEE